jgi:hypothetical protein
MVGSGCVGLRFLEPVQFQMQKSDLEVDAVGDGKTVKLSQQLLARPLIPAASGRIADYASQVVLHSL